MPLSLREAIEKALKHNRGLKASETDAEAFQSGVGRAKGAFWPRLDIVEGFTYTDKPTLVFSSLLDQASFKQRDFAVGSLNEPTPLTNLSSQIRLEQPLYTGGRLTASWRQARAAAEASKEVTKRTRQGVVLSVIESYYRVLLAKANSRVIQKALDSARAHLERSQELYEKGQVVRADFLRAQVLAGSLEREKMAAESSITIEHSHLGHVLGTEDESFVLTETVREDSAPLGDLASLKGRAKELRTDLKAAERQIERAWEAVRIAQADYYPSMGLVTQFEGNTRKFSTSGESFAIFLAAKWNLFNGFATQEKVAEEEALHRKAKLLRDDLLYSISLEVERAYLGLSVARRQVEVARENVLQAEESLRILRDRYSVGLARNVDVLDGETALKRAEQDLLHARVNSQIFRARLNLATGE
jgi:outer membrane protein TolC